MMLNIVLQEMVVRRKVSRCWLLDKVKTEYRLLKTATEDPMKGQAEEAEGMVKPGKFQELVAKAVLSYLHRIWVLFYSIISQRKAGNQSQADYQRIHLLKKKFVTMRDHLGKKWIGSNWKGRQTVRSIGKNFKWQRNMQLWFCLLWSFFSELETQEEFPVALL